MDHQIYKKNIVHIQSFCCSSTLCRFLKGFEDGRKMLRKFWNYYELLKLRRKCCRFSQSFTEIRRLLRLNLITSNRIVLQISSGEQLQMSAALF